MSPGPRGRQRPAPSRLTIPRFRRAFDAVRLIVVVLAALVLAGRPTPAATELLVSSFWPPSHLMRAQVLSRWAAEVTRATEGRVVCRFPSSSLAPPPRQWHMVTSGIADVGIVFNGFERNRLHLPTVSELPFGTPSAEAASVALWRTYARYFEPAHEFGGVQLLGLMTHSGGDLYSLARDIRGVADLHGLKIRTTDGSSSLAMESLGAVAVPSSGVDAYQLVSRGIVDGLIMPTGDMRTFNMLQYAAQAIEVPGKIYNGSFSLFVNTETWQSLLPRDRLAILGVSGEAFARLARAWDESDRRAVQEITARGIHRTTASGAFLEDLHTALAFLDDAWIREANRRGIDGRAALEFFRAEADRVSRESPATAGDAR